MSDTAILTPPPPVARPGVSVLAIASLAIGAIIAFLHLTVRLLDAALGSDPEVYKGAFPIVMGVLGLASFIPIAAGIVLGHLAIVRTRDGARRGRALAWIGTVIGYALLVLWFNRIIVTIIATVVLKDGKFVQDFFWWA
ncbi:MAG: DUF4190 domain-containing protein [Actinomycetota bacterium]